MRSGATAMKVVTYLMGSSRTCGGQHHIVLSDHHAALSPLWFLEDGVEGAFGVCPGRRYTKTLWNAKTLEILHLLPN
jgi:hypothetical protein